MPTLLSTLEAGVRTLTLNRPERANAFDQELITALLRAFDEAARDPRMRFSESANRNSKPPS